MTRVSHILAALIVLAPVGASAFSATSGPYRISASHNPVGIPPVQLDVAPMQQSENNSCGEAALTIAYNYAYPGMPLEEWIVIDYAEMHGLYMPETEPFTSPANMVAIAHSFRVPVASGNVASADDGLGLLYQQLQAGNPIVIDVTTRLDDLNSGAHFIVVMGIGTDPRTGNTSITYDNPLDGQSESADWNGQAGIWKAWRNNGDPGGSGWWLVISRTPIIPFSFVNGLQ